jgi:uncharacterized repeat protein (TIGR01451 family)
MIKPRAKKEAKSPRAPRGSLTENAEVEKSLEAIFQDEDDTSDLKTFEKKRTSPIVVVLSALGALVIVLIIAAWAGFAIFKPFRGFQGDGIQLTIDGPARIALGQETTFFVNWQNIANEPIASSEMHVSFPADFTLTSTDPATTGDGLRFRLGSIPFGGRGTIAIKGVFTGALGSKTAIQVVSTYRPSSFNSDFESLTTKAIEYTDTVLDGVIEAPEKSLPGDTVRLAYTLHNRGTTPLQNLEMRLHLPEGFTRSTTSTSVGGDGKIAMMMVPTLDPGATSTLVVMGSFVSGSGGGEITLNAETGRMGVEGTFQATQKTEAKMTVLSGDLSLKLVVNGADSDRSVAYGAPLRISIGYENTASEELKDVEIRLIAEPIIASGTNLGTVRFPLDWSEVELASTGTRSGNTITWDGDSLGVLERLPSRSDGVLDLTIPLISTASSTDALGVRLIIEASMKGVGKTKVDRTIRTAPMNFFLQSDAAISSQAWYFSEEGAQLGSGPLPPVSGQTTSYRVMWTLTKSVHELEDIRVSATLPKNVSWPDRTSVSAGTILYDEPNRTISWTINRLPGDVNEALAEFTVELTPSTNDAGRFADLMGETRFVAEDTAINGEAIMRSRPGLTTDLENDEGAKSKGVVRKP